MCVRPTSPPNVNCDCDTDNVIDCYSTLNDWIDGSNRISPFINNSSSNSDIAGWSSACQLTKDRLVIEDVHFTGD